MRFNFLLIMILLMASVAGAKIWRVNSNAGADADFTDMQSAHNNATSGDTIYVEGSATNYGNSTIAKQLYIFGPGYFLSENPETQVNTESAKLWSTTFTSGSEGTIVTGCNFSNYCYVYTDSITLRGNIFWFMVYIGDNSAIDEVVFSQNYCAEYSMEVRANATNITIRNSHIRYLTGTSTSYLTFYNNVIEGDLTVHNSVLNNNIMKWGSFSGSNNIYNNNLANGTQFGTDNGNQANVVMDNIVFVSGGTTDGKFQLASGSPAIEAGINGEDCGMFGGSTPYVLSGLMDVPSIWSLATTGPGTAAGGLNVQIKAKSN
ncbi:MAG: hypothetical protein JSU77_04450 [Fidelibacterota bacterium]|nr:MAG: hypothetical protein JSU77_04450 [Candidatus Neomarinimicrobiota bacterium]